MPQGGQRPGLYQDIENNLCGKVWDGEGSFGVGKCDPRCDPENKNGLEDSEKITSKPLFYMVSAPRLERGTV